MPCDSDRAWGDAENTAVVDGFQVFLNQVGRCRLLTPVEEVVLAKAVERGDPAARRRMIESNLRLVVAIARPYARLGVPLPDLVQEGTIGLDAAVRRYDWRRGHRFSTYATTWIRQAVIRALEKEGRTIRLPVGVGERLRALSRARQSLEGELGREPTLAELAGETGFSVPEVNDVLDAATVRSSLNQPAGADGDELGKLIADRAARDPADEAEASIRREWLRSAVSRLPSSERDVVEGRLRERSVDDIASDLGIARQQVRQLERRALARLALLGFNGELDGSGAIDPLSRRGARRMPRRVITRSRSLDLAGR